MRFSNGKKTRRQTSKKQNFGYDNLEDRRVLATLVSFAGGDLSISMDANNDATVVSVATNGNVVVNGSQDVNSGVAGLQTASASSVQSISINGDASRAQQVVVLNSTYTQLDSLSIQNVNQVTVNGVYETQDLSVTLVGTDGRFTDSPGGRLRADGLTTIRGNDNMVLLDSASNNFNVVDVTNGGTGRDITIYDVNDIQFSNAVSTGDFNVTAGGDITDPAGANISIAGFTRFDADNVELGDSADDTTNFMAISSMTTGDLDITEDSSVTLLNISADNLSVSSSGGIFDGRRTSIDVNSNSSFDSATRIRIGENGTDTFNTSTLTFNSDGHVQIVADSNALITGNNTANSLTLFSSQDIADSVTATIDVENITHFEGANVIIGDSATDRFNSGSLHFFTPGDFNLTEDSGTHLIETKNEARRLFLNSTGAITDADDTRVTVERISDFTAESVNIGDSGNDLFNTGSISFTTAGRFAVNENSATNIVGFNSAERSVISSAGAITNNFLSEDGLGATIDVETIASFDGTSIDLGQQQNDTLTFGSLQVNSPGDVTVVEDDATHLTLSNDVGSLNLTSGGAVTDAVNASINVNGNASVNGTSIRWGENTTDSFNAQNVTFNSAGAVQVTENSAMHLVGSNSALSMTLAAAGNLTDAVEAETRVTNLFSATGALVNLGSESTDVLEVGQLSFNSTANTFITTDSAFEIIGNNRAGDRLTLVSSGAITDSPTAQIEAENFASFDGTSVLIGELATDCFDILNGGAPFVLGGTATLGGC